MNVTVVGLGKIGLPLAVQFASRGHTVAGVDLNAELVDTVNSAREPFPGEFQLAELLVKVVADGRLRAVADYGAAVPLADVVVVVVPLLVNEEDSAPNFTALDSATREIAHHLTSGTLVIYETTLPVGTTRLRWKPRLEDGSGLREGSDFHLVFSPERVLTGRVFSDLRKYPKLVGGLSAEGVQLAREFYDSSLTFDARDDLPMGNGVWDMGTAEAAEFAKLAETTYRDVNIGLANEFARFADVHRIDIYNVIEACNSQPFSNIHRPGIAVGGHCIPVYPRLYLYNAPESPVVQAGRESNFGMPKYAVARLAAEFGNDLKGRHVVILGASYRGGVKETALSGVFPIRAALEEFGAKVSVHDPFFSEDELTAIGLNSYDESELVDAAVLQADHEIYRKWHPALLPGIKILFDGRNVLDDADWPGVRRIVIGA